MKVERLTTNVLIIGGGTAGCYAALTLYDEAPDLSVIVAEKADIVRSGCLAAGVNALNAYITEGHTPSFYADYAMKDADGIARYDLLLSMSEHLNEVTERLERLGLVILKDENGKYVSRGARNIKINGENIKPILAKAVNSLKNVKVINHLNISDLILGADGRVIGALGNSIDEEKLYIIFSKAVIIATGGAAGIYKPNHPGFSRHKMWYCPFNTGAGYAMGIRAGAEMTTFEMRFIALRCKDTIAPVGTLAQGVHAKQVNSYGEIYEDKYGLTTSERLYGTVKENEKGRGPCYLKTIGISRGQAEDLEKAYLNMAPSQTLKWISSGRSADEENVQIEGTEPYIVGGHTASGFFVDEGRRTTVKGLYAAGDVAGGCPQKYVTGALAEGELAAKTVISDLNEELGAKSAVSDLKEELAAKAVEKDFFDEFEYSEANTKLSSTNLDDGKYKDNEFEEDFIASKEAKNLSEIISEIMNELELDSNEKVSILNQIENYFKMVAAHISENDYSSDPNDAEKSVEDYVNNQAKFSEGLGESQAEILEAEMQDVMDRYAGGISTHYAFTEESLDDADSKINDLIVEAEGVKCSDFQDLTHFLEVRERLLVSRVLIQHLKARRETRWHSFDENRSYPDKDPEYGKVFINSRLVDGRVEIIKRPIEGDYRSFTIAN